MPNAMELLPLLQLKETLDLNEVGKVFFDAEIWERIGGDVDIELPKRNTRYIAGYVSDEIMGVFVYYYRKNCITCHIQVLKKYRAKYALKFGKEALKFEVRRPLFTNIPHEFEDVKRFAEYFNFAAVAHDNEKTIYRMG